jgi:hypothetical protein
MYSVKQMVLVPGKDKKNNDIQVTSYNMIGNHLSFKEAKELRKSNKNSSIFPEVKE